MVYIHKLSGSDARNLPYLTRQGYHPIHLATQNGNHAEISRLVANGTDVDTETDYIGLIDGNYVNSGPTQYPLHIAYKKNDVPTMLLLLDIGANPNKPTQFYYPKALTGSSTHEDCDTFLETFASSNHCQNLQVLLKLKEKGYYISGARYSKWLVNGTAIGDESHELLKFLLKEGANPHESPEQGKSILSHYLQHPKNLKLLRSYGVPNTKFVPLERRYKGDTLKGYINAHRLPKATIKALTDPVKLKYLRSSGGTPDDPRVPGLTAKIERLESQLLACGQSLETCESEKASMRAQLSSLGDKIAALSKSLTQARGESTEKNRTIDGLSSAKTDLEKSIGLLKVAVNEGSMTQDRLKAEVKWMEEAILIMNGAVTSSDGSEEIKIDNPYPYATSAESKLDDGEAGTKGNGEIKIDNSDPYATSADSKVDDGEAGTKRNGEIRLGNPYPYGYDSDY